MRFEDLSLRIRPRHPWEAIDLGIRMTQHWGREVYTAWVLVTLPLFVFLNIVFRDSPGWALLLMWWLKPLYDRALLYVYSHLVFGQPVNARQLLAALPGLLWGTGLWLHLSIYRLDFARSFRLPVWQLEGLRGRRRSERTKVLARRAGGYASWLTLIGVHIEAIFQFAVLGIIWLFIPEMVFESVWEYFWNMFSGDTFPYWFLLASNLVHYLAMSAVEPLYVAGGFALYLNRRTQLEGWDIEMVFRRLANRLKGLSEGKTAQSLAALMLITVLLGGWLGHVPPAYAENAEDREVLAEQRLTPDRVSGVIDEVIQDKDFGGKRTVERWVLRDRETSASDDEAPDLSGLQGFVAFLAKLAEVLLWIGVIILVVFLVMRISRAIGPREEAQEQAAVPAVISGLDIRPESLPDDIPGEARRLWQAGRHRDALGLIYRGTVSALVHRYAVELTESSTEGDVLNAGRRSLRAETGDFLGLVTRLWQTMAYAHRRPADAEVLPMLDGWSRHFAEGSTGSEVVSA